MSWYTNYRLGVKKEDGKIYPLGVFDAKGKGYDIISTSRSFTTDLKESFRDIKDDEISDELRKEYEYKIYEDEIEMQDLQVLPLKDLPHGNYVKTGYFLIDDIERYIKNGYYNRYDDIFYDTLSPEVFGMKMNNELAFGIPEKKYDCDGEEIEYHSCAEYAYFAYPDYQCKEYEAFLLREIASIYFKYGEVDDSNIYVIKTEG